MTTSETAKEGKTDLVKDVLAKNARANTSAVNEAWTAAGRSGQISATLVNKLRSSLGLAGNLRARTKKVPTPATNAKGVYTGKKRGRKPKNEAAVTAAAGIPHLNGRKTAEAQPQTVTRGRTSARHIALEELEADFDRLLFKVMGVGGLQAIEESLRQSRRLLYGGFNGNLS